MALQRYWYINGRHYSLTLEAWLARMDQHRKQIMPIMQVWQVLCDTVLWPQMSARLCGLHAVEAECTGCASTLSRSCTAAISVSSGA